MRRVNFSPTTEPIEPPRKLKSITPSAARCADFADAGDDRVLQPVDF
jgi:hypothetical protein